MNGFELSRSASRDLREIGEYTLERFGHVQARRFRAQLREALERLAEAPLAGRPVPELSSQLRSWTLLGVFVVIYEPTTSGLRVARVLHGARNLATELDRDPGD